jgi:Tol biopolymer transport system component
MKSLEKARERRYDNASALALDIRRHLKDQPILARAPGTFYRLHKFFRRHRFQVAASLIVSVLAVTLLIVVFSDGKFDELPPSEREMFLRHRTTLRRATDLFKNGNHDAAWANLVPILYSKHVGSEARRLRDQILAEIREHVRSSTQKIKTNPEDARNYLLRAQQYYCLRETENMIADMEMYVNILSPLDETNPQDLWFRDFLMGLWQSTPTNLGPTVNSSVQEWGSSLSPDGLSLYFESNRAGGEGKHDIWVSTRATREEDWGAPVNLGRPINTSAIEQSLCISADGLELYFNDHPLGPRAGSVTDGGDLWVATRATVSDPWGDPENLGLTSNINTSKTGIGPSLSSDGLSLFLASPWPKDPFLNDWDLYVSTRPTRDDLWSEPVNLGPTVNGVNSTSLNFCPAISADGLLLVFSSNRPGGYGGQDLWMTRRSTTDGPWSEPVNLGPTINSDKWEVEPEISPDGRSLLFCSGRGGGHGDFDIWQVPIVPAVGNLKQDGDSDSAVESDKSNGGKEG